MVMPINMHKKNSGFTLIEIMLVIVLVGIMASLVQFNFNNNRPEDLLKKESERFSAVFNLAAEYSLLNNAELGVLVDKTSYQFLGHDGVHWVEIPEQPALALYTLPETIELTLALDDLPIEEPLLFDSKAYIALQEENFTSEEAKKKKRIPQIYLFSGGDISAFSITFTLKDEIMHELNVNAPIAYRVSGLYSTPLTIEGPTFEP
jgi:general secretion pathway protein H